MNLLFDPRSVDRLADSVFSAWRPADAQGLPVDIYRTAEHIVLHCDLPGVDPGSIEIGVDGKVLTIRAQRTARTMEGVEWLVRERASGTVVRQLTLGDGLDTERITATCDNGVLTLTMPLAERAKPRRIPVQGFEQGAMDGGTESAESTTVSGEIAA